METCTYGSEAGSMKPVGWNDKALEAEPTGYQFKT